jgi:hypothetical protein
MPTDDHEVRVSGEPGYLSLFSLPVHLEQANLQGLVAVAGVQSRPHTYPLREPGRHLLDQHCVISRRLQSQSLNRNLLEISLDHIR